MSTPLVDLYVAPDGTNAPTIWRRRPESSLGDEALLTRSGANAGTFDTFAEVIARIEPAVSQALDDHAALVAELWDAYMVAQNEPGPMDWIARAVLTSDWLKARDARMSGGAA
ncbi:MAG: hypothetical protein AVDCRST_MAG83-1690 [uncultured Arthrobacter sp.]|uniref:Uncharacterized protein n=1 Tax=uncultured Arthrobacter sp. TaxID=114050 RepID=A0A6J4I626_9MICC|nr:hypothetical protein [uncultured Arthrobacter sp.]CAA9242107.1 MAG: hypothetical protein AVDCRST_MAG83-1690 [uncultured Arthrobacter sp.]